MELHRHKKLWSILTHPMGEFALSGNPEIESDVIVEVGDTVAVVGYMSYSGDIDDPRKTDEGFNSLYEMGDQKQRMDFLIALGLDEYEAPDYGHLMNDMSEDDALAWWTAERLSGRLGDKYAVVINRHHPRMCEVAIDHLDNFTYNSSHLAWTPCTDVRNQLDALGDAWRERALELAQETFGEFDDWCNGETYDATMDVFFMDDGEWVLQINETEYFELPIGRDEAMKALTDRTKELLASVQ